MKCESFERYNSDKQACEIINNNGKTVNGVDIEGRKKDYQKCLDLPTQNEQQLCREELVSKLAGDVDDGLTYCEGEGESQLNTSEDDGDWEHSKMLCVEHKAIGLKALGFYRYNELLQCFFRGVISCV